MKSLFKKLVCTALSGILFVSAAALPSFAKKHIMTDEEIEKYINRPMILQVYRLYNPLNHEHFYTTDLREKNGLAYDYGWIYEGVGWYAPEKSKTPVYRLFNPILRDHHYTTSKVERDKLIAKDHWIDEGIGWYSDDNKGEPLYRQFAPFLTSGSHNYTTDPNERKVLTKERGWVDEGVSWYGFKDNHGKPDFTEADVIAVAEELGLKYNKNLTTDNAGWAGLDGEGFELVDISGLEDVKGWMMLYKYDIKKANINNPNSWLKEVRLITITPENFDNTFLVNPETNNGIISIAGNNKEEIEINRQRIKNGAKAYILCYN